MTLGIQAVRFYFEKQGKTLTDFNSTFLVQHYIPIFVRCEEVHIHTPSVIAFCHLTDPEQFMELTRYIISRDFRESRQLGTDGINRTFRVIPERGELWKEISA